MKAIPLEGLRFGKYLVLERTASVRGMTQYRARCECGVENKVFAKHLRSGSSRSCRPCSVKNGTRHHQWAGVGDISGGWWASHVGRCVTLSARSPKALTVTIEQGWNLFLKQGRRCALSGLPIAFPSVVEKTGTASLDRIDSAGGYTPENIQWVHKDVNKMKNAFPQPRFIELCRKVASACPIK